MLPRQAQPPKATVVLGPGQHGDALVEALVRAGMLRRVVREWPHFTVQSWPEDGNGPVNLSHTEGYDRLRWLTWALWRRLPLLGRYETPKGALFSLFDLLARRYIQESDLFVGWSQVSLRSMRRAKQQGAVTVLEHPMSHVETWMRLAEEEHARWGSGDGCYPLVPRLVVERMKQECAEADYISVLSSFAQRTFLDAGVPEQKLIEVPLGVDHDLFQPGSRAEGPFRILYGGRLELLKGVQYLVQAFSELRLPEAELWLVGPISPEIRPVLSRFASEKVRVVGEVPHDQIRSHYQCADVLVFPSINDAFGLVILEAMACGLPVIATDHSAASDVLEDGVDGFVVPVRDVNALKDRLLQLVGDRRGARSMGMVGRARVVESFTLAHYRERVVKAYQGIMPSGPFCPS